MPAIQWKLINIRKMDLVKHKKALDQLINALVNVIAALSSDATASAA